MRTPFFRRFRRDQRGVETIEVAIALPLVLLVVFAGCEYGWVLLRSLQADHAAREGARAAALYGVTSAQVQSRVQTVLDDAGIAGATVSLDPFEPALVPAGTTITVHVAVPYRQNKLLGLSSLMPLPQELGGRASMLKEPDP